MGLSAGPRLDLTGPPNCKGVWEMGRAASRPLQHRESHRKDVVYMLRGSAYGYCSHLLEELLYL